MNHNEINQIQEIKDWFDRNILDDISSVTAEYETGSFSGDNDLAVTLIFEGGDPDRVTLYFPLDNPNHFWRNETATPLNEGELWKYAMMLMAWGEP